MNIEIEDFAFHISGGMDRGKHPDSPGRIHYYTSEDFNYGGEVSVDLELLVKYVTNLKLNAFLIEDPDV